MITVKFFNGMLATYEDGVWTSDRSELAEMLNSEEVLRVEHGPVSSAADPDPEQSSADWMIDLFGGEVVVDDAPPEEYVKDRVY